MKRFIIAALAMFALAALAPQAEAGGLLGRIFAPRVAVVGGNAVAVRAPFVNVGVGRQFVPVQRVASVQQFVPVHRRVPAQFFGRSVYQTQRQFVPVQSVFLQPSYGVQQFGFAPAYSGGFQSSFSYGQSFGAAGGCGAFLGY